MQNLDETRRQMAAIDLVEGLPPEESLSRFGQGVRLGDVGHRFAAFYAVDLFAGAAYEKWGHRTLEKLIDARFHVDRRRLAEYVCVGTKLKTLPLIDRAFREDRLRWSQVLLLVRVASIEHEAAWLALAQRVSRDKLQIEVRQATPGGPPRKPGQRRGIHEIHTRHSYTVTTVDDETIRSAQRKLSAELGRKVGEAELLVTLADLFLHLQDKREDPEHECVDASLYHLVLRPEQVAPDHEHGDGDCDHDHRPLLIDTDHGRIPVNNAVLETCIRCDAETHSFDRHGNPMLDAKTGKTLRQEVLIRDGLRCRCCGSPYRLHVHHITYRSKNGETKAYNLLALCIDCHSLLHAGLLFIDGENESEIVFVDRDGRPLHQPEQRVDAKILLKLSAPLVRKGKNGTLGSLPGVDPFEPPVTLASVPPRIDGTWWRRHAPLIQPRHGQGIRFRPGHPLSEEEVAEAESASESASAASAAAGSGGKAFEGLVGQQSLLRRLLTAADASRTLGRPFPHTLFVGPPGTGKTTLARGVATALGGHLTATAGPLLQNSHDLLTLLAELREGDVFFIDEVHAVPRPVLEVLYQAMADGCVDLTFHAQSRARSTCLELPAFTFLAATTEENDVPEALRARFGFREVLGFYDEADLSALLEARARERDVFFRTGAAVILARAARGTPREALRLLDRVLDELSIPGNTTPDVAAVHGALAALGYDERGLDARDQRYLALLQARDAPVPLVRIAALLGTDERTVLRHIEPHLFRLGLVGMTSQGRQLARQGDDKRASNAPNGRHVTEVPNIRDRTAGGAILRGGRRPPPVA